MWRLLFCKHKLNYQEVVELGKVLDDTSYSCDVALSDLDLPDWLKNMSLRDHKCGDPIEKLYYSCGFEPICMKCSSEDVQSSTDFFPLCSHFLEQGTSPTPHPKRRKPSS